MSKIAVLSCDVLANDIENPLEFKVTINDKEVFSAMTTKSKYKLYHKFTDDGISEYNIKFILSGKTNEHTELDNDGNFLKSSQIEVRNISINGVNISKLLEGNDTLMTYTHNTNGHTGEIVDNEYVSCMGYNGILEFKITTPIYMWILEHMQ